MVNIADSLNSAMYNKFNFSICGSMMQITYVETRKGVTSPDETLIQVHLKSIEDETKILITGSPQMVIDLIGKAQ